MSLYIIISLSLFVIYIYMCVYVCIDIVILHRYLSPTFLKFVSETFLNIPKCSIVYRFHFQSEAMRIVRTVGQAFEVCHKLTLQNQPSEEKKEDDEEEKNGKQGARSQMNVYEGGWYMVPKYFIYIHGILNAECEIILRIMFVKAYVFIFECMVRYFV